MGRFGKRRLLFGALDSGLAVRMKKAVGLRNIAVHSYQAIDWEIVYAICRKNVGDFRAFARAIIQMAE